MVVFPYLKALAGKARRICFISHFYSLPILHFGSLGPQDSSVINGTANREHISGWPKLWIFQSQSESFSSSFFSMQSLNSEIMVNLLCGLKSWQTRVKSEKTSCPSSYIVKLAMSLFFTYKRQGAKKLKISKGTL